MSKIKTVFSDADDQIQLTETIKKEEGVIFMIMDNIMCLEYANQDKVLQRISGAVKEARALIVSKSRAL